MRRSVCTTLLLLGLVLTGCNSGTTGTDNILTVMGNAGSPLAVKVPGGTSNILVETGDPAALLIGMYALYISPNADCSGAVLVQSYGFTASIKDFVSHPTLFSGPAEPGSYQCVAVKMSDVIRVVPDSSFGACVAGTEYPGDIYREGETDWKDIDLNPVIGTGTDSVPADDHVTIIMTRDTAAAIARGFSTNQVIDLGSDLIVPGRSTFYWHGEGTVVTDGVQCGVNPGHPSFE
jgi:hypothetical protein